MPRLPRRYRKAKKAKRARKGKVSANTKVDLSVAYRSVVNMRVQPMGDGSSGLFYSYYQFSPQNANSTNVANHPEFAAQSKLYDEFKVSSVTVSFKPFMTVQSYVNTLKPTDNQMYLAVDRDGGTILTAATNTVQALQAYDSVKAHAITKPWKRTLKLKSWWCDCTVPNLIPGGGASQPWINSGAIQTLHVYVENLFITNMSPVGEITYTYNVQFRGKKPVSFTYEPNSGSVVITPLESFNNVALVAFNPPVPFEEQHFDTTIQCDGSGNIQVISNLDGTIASLLGGTVAPPVDPPAE